MDLVGARLDGAPEGGGCACEGFSNCAGRLRSRVYMSGKRDTRELTAGKTFRIRRPFASAKDSIGRFRV